MQTVVYQCDTAMPAQKLPNCCDFCHVCFSILNVEVALMTVLEQAKINKRIVSAQLSKKLG